MKILTVSAIAVLGVALSGCATIIDGPSQKIAISTLQVRGAKCVLTTARGRKTVMTPGVVKVKRSGDDIPVRCTKDGYKPVSATIPSGFDNWALGNVVTAGVGAGIDAVTGSINDYPDSFRIRMKPDNGYSDQPAPYDQTQPYDQPSPYDQTAPAQDPDSGY